MHDPQDPHMQVVFHILEYLKSGPRKGLHFSKQGHLPIELDEVYIWLLYTFRREPSYLEK